METQVKTLDSLMQTNNPNILNLLTKDVSFGHSNGWIQNIDDFKKDILSKKVDYKLVTQTALKEFKIYKKTASIRRIIHVVGTYKSYDFAMNLSVLEIWIKKAGHWKLWSRQSIELKN
ncbi:nuclear transport factor 2 family protein [Soonwooa sp.]|uniref:nuclear transport factor 2 family protein n=1 Tax=Soonwooa sp. TaxID=1938592 RepID=UPI00261A8AF1|nr:nuclear transport factor 2 family protein [Soonwooa sp.]